MKICACIAEYNPFHLGHKKHIDYMKEVLGAEKIIVIMSGNFTQRGEIAVLDKFTRASHAIKAGADLVLELPTPFATANAEIFAKGAVKVLNSLGVVDGICFGVESGEKKDYILLADALNDESKEFKKALKDQLDMGVSLAKAKFEAVKSLGKAEYDQSLVSSPNNILGLEYTKAILKLESNMDIFPMIRTGNHNDEELKKGITSATSIRKVLKTGKKRKLKKCVPPFVYKDLGAFPFAIDNITMASVYTKTEKDLEKVCDCTEGLENRIKAFSKDNLELETLVDKVSTKRYTKTRVRRILTANLLGIKKKDLEDFLDAKLYAKVLAVKEESKSLISQLSTNSSIPVLTRKSDVEKLKKTAMRCYDFDVLANDIYNLVSGKKVNENQMLIIK